MLKKEHGSLSHGLRRSHIFIYTRSIIQPSFAEINRLLKSQQEIICHILFQVARCSKHPAATQFLESCIEFKNVFNTFLHYELGTY